MKKTREIITKSLIRKLIVLFIAALVLSGCQGLVKRPDILAPEAESVDAATVIKYNTAEDSEGERALIVGALNVPFKDKIYTFNLNGPVNYASGNDYFYTGDNLVYLVSKEERRYGIYEEDDNIISVQQLDELTDIIIKGKDLDSIKSILSNIYLSDSISYQMFDHNISKEWTEEVIITDQVVSLSNGEDTVYVYHNEGSPDGPTIFYKQLDNIDIPITYPEEGFGFNYIPYGFTEYDHLTVEGYTPYSAYDFGKLEVQMVKERGYDSLPDEFANVPTEYGSAYIILAKNDEQVYSLFNEKTDQQSRQAVEVNFVKNKIYGFTINNNVEENLLHVEDIAEETISSDNRYHTQLLDKNEDDIKITYTSERVSGSVKKAPYMYNYLTETHIDVDGDYYMDGQEGYIAPPQDFYIITQYQDGYEMPGLPGTQTETIFSGMMGKLIIPTLKINRPTYPYATDSMHLDLPASYNLLYMVDVPYHHGVSLQQYSVTEEIHDDTLYQSKQIMGHGAHSDDDLYVKYKSFDWFTNFGIREYININDFVYLREADKLYIYRCDLNEVGKAKWRGSAKEYRNSLVEEGKVYDLYTISCYSGDDDDDYSIINGYTLVSVINLNLGSIEE